MACSSGCPLHGTLHALARSWNSSATLTRQRRRPTLEQQLKNDRSPFPDQIAESTQFEPNHLISASYSANKEPGNVRHGKIIVKLAEPQKQDYTDPLSAVKSAEEYVQKALQLQAGIQKVAAQQQPLLAIQQQNVIEQKSKFPEYEVYENHQAQIGIQHSTQPNYDSYDYTEQASSSSSTQSLYSGYSTETYQHPKQPQQVNQPSDAKNADYQEQYPQAGNPDYYENTEHSTVKNLELYQQLLQPTADKADYYGPVHQPAEKSSTYHEHLAQSTRKPHPEYYQQHVQKHKSNFEDLHTENPLREEILKQIEESVNKYMKNLENGGKLPRGTVENENKNVYKPKERPQIPEKPTHPPLPNAGPVHDIVNNLNDNIQFIYKARTRPPIPQKISLNFDHNAALKNLQEFDLSHVLTGEQPAKPQQPQHSFAKDNYPEVNELRSQHFDNKPRNFNLHRENQNLNKNIQETSVRPVTNPYHAIAAKHSAEGNWQPVNPENIHTDNDSSYDTYNPKFNNNPDGFGYQHNYKVPDGRGNHSAKRHIKPTKRGRRGGNINPARNNFNLNKDIEANVALRPPPY
ncbi:unnamed protein product [Hermetia illucens]|uniref:Uncharacterized protein n=1 Tax=Hermetia illucens TaxID=343691 RepID=A0A7R8UTE4_HERIL|nr:unnamed protein product [Hermetia illucens]